MIISLKDHQKSHLVLLTKSTLVLQDFCKLAVEYLSKGPNQKLYQSAAQKLELEAEVVQHAVEALVNLFIEICRHQLSPLDVRDTILTVGFSEEQCEILQDCYNSRQQELVQVLARQSVDLPQFKDLEWRLEAKLGSRALLEQMTPQVTMRLSLDNSKGTEHLMIQADPACFASITESLETALREASSQHCRRVQRRFK